MKRKRLDEILIEGGWATSKGDSFVMVTEGRVFVGGQKAISPAQVLPPETKIEVRTALEFVGRGAYKLEAAFKKFEIGVKNKICADIGSATGGFTEVLLKNGATKVYAVDTARGKLAMKLREDRRVVVREGEDIRDISLLPEAIDCATIDVSLVRLEEILPSVKKLLTNQGFVVALFKPQYEARDPKILRHGIVKDDASREKLLSDFIKWTKKYGWVVVDTMESPIRGSEGNVEYLLYLTKLIKI